MKKMNMKIAAHVAVAWRLSITNSNWTQVHNSLIKVREIYSFKEKLFYLKRGRMIFW